MADGILPTLSVAENLLLGPHRFVLTGPLGYDPERVVAMAAARRSPSTRIAPPRPRDRGAPSGGNIQKILIARALALGAARDTARPPRAQPVPRARHPDHDIRAALPASDGEPRARGGVLLVSSRSRRAPPDCHRILVMFHGALVADLSAEAFDPYRIGRLMAGAGHRMRSLAAIGSRRCRRPPRRARALMGGDSRQRLRHVPLVSLGSLNGLSQTLNKTCPLLLGGLAVGLALRAGYFNIGVDGQIYAGAIAATGLALGAGGLPAVVCCPRSSSSAPSVALPSPRCPVCCGPAGRSTRSS